MAKTPKLKAIKVVELPNVDITKETGAQVFPVHAMSLQVDGNMRGLAFTIARRSYRAMTPEQRTSMAQVLGALVHPFPCTLIEVEEQGDLRAFAVVAA